MKRNVFFLGLSLCATALTFGSFKAQAQNERICPYDLLGHLEKDKTTLTIGLPVSVIIPANKQKVRIPSTNCEVVLHSSSRNPRRLSRPEMFATIDITQRWGSRSIESVSFIVIDDPAILLIECKPGGLHQSFSPLTQLNYTVENVFKRIPGIGKILDYPSECSNIEEASNFNNFLDELESAQASLQEQENPC
jgi:hypothetical protein